MRSVNLPDYSRQRINLNKNKGLNEFFCVPQAQFIGVTPQDIEDYKLPTHPLKDVDLKKIKDLMSASINSKISRL